MALIECAECSGQVSDKAAACPHCGAPVEVSTGLAPAQTYRPGRYEEIRPSLWADQSRSKTPGRVLRRVLLTIIGVMIVLGWALGAWESSPSGGSRSPAADTGEPIEAFLICQDFVEDRLKAPATAEYPSDYRKYTERLASGRFRVTAYVDAQNSFGAQVRTDFVCVVKYVGDETWELESLALDE